MARSKTKTKHAGIRIELSPRSVFLWSLFLLFLLFWVFVLGIFVGKGLLTGVMPDLKNPFKIFQEISVPKEEYEYKKPKEDPKLIFYDKLVNKKNEAVNNSVPPKEVKPPAQEVTLSRDDSTENADEQDAHEIRKELRHDASPEVISGEMFSVQAASISDLENAEKLVKELVDKDYDAYYYITTVRGKKTYRVMCGRFGSRDDALEYLKKLAKDTGYKGFVSRIGK